MIGGIMKKIIALLILLFPTIVYATSYNTPVNNNLSYSECIKFQDSKVATDSSRYFGHCKKAYCYTGEWETEYYISSNMVTCTNGNNSPYIQIINSGCDQYKGTCTVSTAIKYCSVVTYYDCAKTSDGKVFVNKGSTVPTTASLKSSNNYLSKLALSEGIINFNKDTIIYNIAIDENVSKISVDAIPENDRATVIVENNENININRPITITVIAEDSSVRIYTVNVKYKGDDSLSSVNTIKNLEIENYNLNFKSSTNTYTLKVDKEVNTLNITKLELDDERAAYEVLGNENLKNRSKIRIIVTAENGNENIYTIKIRKPSNMKWAIYLIILIIIGIIGVVGYKLISNLLPAKEDKDYGYE